MIKKVKRKLKKVKELQDSMHGLSDEELSGLTVVFKGRLAKGETLDDILPEAYAAICEADYRILGMYPYDVQIMGGIALHWGMLCEMNTGEGKTLVATMPLYLNALTGKSCMLMTTNDYLASRDYEELGPVYRFMNLTVGCCAAELTGEKRELEEKKEIYNSDIVYATNSGVGFDYLINNLVTSADKRFLRDFYYVIVDEADAVLLDSANMPLVIAGSPRVQSNLYNQADFFVTTLEEDEDYEKEGKSVWLTENGIKRAEAFYRVNNFYDEKYFEINRHVNLALKAHITSEKGKDYVLTDKSEVVLMDGNSGRLMPGVKLRGGIHQALEAKEKVEITQETRSIASVTYQNLFGLFEKVAGMSGTISDTREEMREIYGLKTIVIPTNRPNIRIDLKDKYYITKKEQCDAALKAVVRAHELGQPVLVVAAEISDTEAMSDLLIKQKIPHSVLNARNAYWEAEIIKEAGQLGTVTVATSIAGRGTDIKLGSGVKELGGLMVVGLGRMDNIRLERQARGRAGRQGDPGISTFFVSLEDDIVKHGDDELYDKYISGKKKIGKARLRRIINGARRLNEEMSEQSRRKSTEQDLVIKRQRELIYETRNNLIDGVEINEDIFANIAKAMIDDYLQESRKISIDALRRFILDNISYKIDDDIEDVIINKKKQVKKYLLEKALDYYNLKRRRVDNDKNFYDFVRVATLTAVDNEWVEEVDYLQQLPSAVAGRSSAQRNPVYEYQNDAIESYKKMKKKVYRNIVRNVLLSSVYVDEKGELSIVFP